MRHYHTKTRRRVTSLIGRSFCQVGWRIGKRLLAEYTTVLRNYKEVKKKLSDREKKDRDIEFEVTLQMRELKSAIAKRDEVINSLRGKLNVLQGDNVTESKALEEEKQKASNPSDDQTLKSEDIEKDTEESNSTKADMKSEIRPIYKHMREIQIELAVWLEQSVLLKDEMKRRSTSLCRIQEEITKALKEGEEENEIRFSSHQAAKLQGEVSNMKQENKKVKKELEAGVDHITTLQVDVEKTVTKLEKEFGLAAANQQEVNNSAGGSIPLRSFIFGTKPKKQRRSCRVLLGSKHISKAQRKFKSFVSYLPQQ
ncbi:hypothetical protein RND71_026124 [Anisodus tanguticus]|uniref:NET2A-D/KIP1-like C-terminal domain-containing protein n=1 Tax=Anisodus tanguticus TaxID=243964 RepID=A0AAE1RKB8_9SOLA|nr:hypothetical protein RND71_026124 [Anisodus tanguticus]